MEIKNGLIVDSHGNKSWWKDDVLHREDGPAVEWVNGHKSWWLNGVKVSKLKPKLKGLEGLHACPGYKDKCSSKVWIELDKMYCVGCTNKRNPPLPVPKVDVVKVVAYVKRKKKNVKKLAKEINVKETLDRIKKENTKFVDLDSLFGR